VPVPRVRPFPRVLSFPIPFTTRSNPWPNLSIPDSAPSIAEPTTRLMPEPAPTPSPTESPAASPSPSPTPSEGLTPLTSPGLQSDSDWERCRVDRDRRRQKKREACNAFIKVTVPRHKRSMCVQDVAGYLLRKFKRKATSALRKRIKERIGFDPFARRPRRRKIPDVKLPGGIEIDVEDLLKGRR